MEPSVDRIVIICTHCGHRGTTNNPNIIGRSARCKACQGVFRVPEIATVIEASPAPRAAEVVRSPQIVEFSWDSDIAAALVAPAPSPGPRPCPFCAEPIQPAAVKCRHCNEWLDGRAAPVVAAPTTSQITIHNSNQLSSSRATVHAGGDGAHLLAALISLLIPGLGQAVRGRAITGFLWFCLTVACYVYLVPAGFAVHMLCVIFAAQPSR